MDAQTEKAIESAEGTTLLRALGCIGPEKDFLNPDDLAHAFLGDRYKRFLKLYKFFPSFFLKVLERRAPGNFWYIYSRTVFLDNALSEAIKAGVEQVVILGAGYDTRFYRFERDLKGIPCFEMDFPGTQAAKIEALEQAKMPKPDNLVFIPIDFTKEELGETLFNHDYNPALRTLFIWEGVCMYLPKETVHEVLSFIKQNSAPGSFVAFDYIRHSAVNENDLSGYGVSEVVAHAKNINEPLLFGFEPTTFKEDIKSLGYDLKIHLSPQGIRAQILKGLKIKESSLNVECAYLATIEATG
ncbi:MAG: SAM-dependent methyltransferase [Pseudomonadales bacterium]|nr:SAM-dependent methyltransferase [Pseudomonadales bacterium]